uniref:Uncharacterized protein n=1 Tax=Oryza punctata TaxID=4537 RepID=A0A0E0LVB5_ORYPU
MVDAGVLNMTSEQGGVLRCSSRILFFPLSNGMTSQLVMVTAINILHNRKMTKNAFALFNMLCEGMRTDPDRVLVTYDQT